MKKLELLAAWESEAAYRFAGWDFSHLDGRMQVEELPWSYLTRASDLLRKCHSALDLGTGGGEVILQLQEAWPKHLTATEDYEPNLELARQRLGPFGVHVERVCLDRNAIMPFGEGEFDLILNRHSGFNPKEVCRTLSKSGWFLTQQVHGLDLQDLLAEFGAKPKWPDATPAFYVPSLESAGLWVVRAQEWSGRRSFTDIGAIVYYLKAIPWLVDGFEVQKFKEVLFALQERIVRDGELRFTDRFYLIEGQKS